MYRVILKTCDFLDVYLELEIRKYFKKEIKSLSKEFFEINFKSEKELCEFTVNFIYFSRSCENIFLEVSDFENEKLEQICEKNIQIKEEIIGKQKLKLVDLVGFDLMKRDYMLNKSESSIDLRAIIFGLYGLEIDRKKKSFSLIDPYANFGEVILESSNFNPRTPLNLRKRFDFNVCKIFKFTPSMPKEQIGAISNYTAIVLDNVKFKQLKENIAFSSQKIKISQFDFTWLDVKFQKDEFDFVITSFPKFKDEKETKDFCDKFFYQAEFIAKQGICVISHEKIDLKYSRKYGIPLGFKKELKIENKSYFVYVF